MLVALGKGDLKTLEDFAGSVPDELTGWTERKEGEATRHPGVLDQFDVSRQQAEEMIMAARLKAGWVTEEDLRPPPAEPDAAAAAAADAAPASAELH
jgi:N utilization substance protein A